MITIPALHDAPPAADVLIARIEALRTKRGWSEAQLARRLDWDQPRLNKCMNQKQRFTVADLDALAAAFEISVPELFFDEYGQWDRRSRLDRRKGDRRQAPQTIYDPSVEPSSEIARLSFAPREKDDV